MEADKVVALNGYLYQQHTVSGQAVFWRCIQRSIQGCPARLRTSVQLSNPVTLNTHNHDPEADPVQLEGQGHEEDLLQGGSEHYFDTVPEDHEDPLGENALQQNPVVSSLGEAFSLDMLADEPPDKIRRQAHMDTDGYNKRKNRPFKGPYVKEMPTEPQDIRDLTVSGMWALTDDPMSPQRFLLYDNKQDSCDRVILFATDDHIRLLGESNEIFLEVILDGCPNMFYQTLVIQAPIRSMRHSIDYSIVSLAFALMGSKKDDTYAEVLSALVSKASDLGVTLSPKTVNADFDKAAWQAVTSVFGPDVLIKGCFYHLNRLVWKRVIELDLVAKASTSEAFRLAATQLVALAFLNPEDVRQGMLYVKKIAPTDDVRIDELLDYFDSTFVSGTVRAKRRKGPGDTIELHQVSAQFPPEKWNFQEAILANNPRTDNIFESSLGRFKHMIGHYRTSFYRCVKFIRMEETYTTDTVRQYISMNAQARPVRKHLIHVQERIQRLVISYNEGEMDMDGFLLAAAKQLRLGEL